MDAGETGMTGILDCRGNPKPAAAEIQRGIALLEKQNQFCPWVLRKTQPAQTQTEIRVKSGCDYDMLTFVTILPIRNALLTVELGTPGTLLMEVNAGGRYASDDEKTVHGFRLEEGCVDSFNFIKFYFGGSRMPLSQTVLAVTVRDESSGNIIFSLQ
jgi:hypothetical protein